MSDIGAITYQFSLGATPSDTPPSQKNIYSAFYVGVSGNVQITDAAGNVTVLQNCQQGTIYPIAFTQIWNSNTSATGIVCMVARPYKVMGT
jgi:hypothetical protein